MIAKVGKGKSSKKAAALVHPCCRGSGLQQLLLLLLAALSEHDSGSDCECDAEYPLEGSSEGNPRPAFVPEAAADVAFEAAVVAVAVASVAS